MTTLPPTVASALASQHALLRLAHALAYDPHDAEDAVQHALAQEGDGRRRATVPAFAFLRAAVRNRLLGLRRAAVRRAAHEQRAARPEAAPSLDEMTAREELRRDVAQAALALAQPYRDVVWLHHFEGQTCAHIARAQGVPSATVRAQLLRAHAMLRQSLDRKYGSRAGWCAFAVPCLVPGAATAWVAVTATVAAVGLGSAAWLFATRESGDAGRRSDVVGSVTAGVEQTAPGARATEPSPAARSLVVAQDSGPPPALAGRVVDESGNGLPDVAIVVATGESLSEDMTGVDAFLTHRMLNPINPPGVRTPSGLWLATDAEGRFSAARLDGKPTVLVVFRIDRGAEFVRPPELATDPLVITLPRHPRVVGRIVDGDGRGVAAVRVVVGSRSGRLHVEPRTDGDGRFASPGLPDGDYYASPSDEHYRFSKYVDAHVKLGMADCIADFTATRRGQLSATLVDGEGRAWTGTRLQQVTGCDPADLVALITQRSFITHSGARNSGHPESNIRYDADSGRIEGTLQDFDTYVLSLWSRGEKLGEVVDLNPHAEKITIALAPAGAPIRMAVSVTLPPTTPAPSEVLLEIVPGADAFLGAGPTLEFRATSTRTTLELSSRLAGQPCWLVVRATGFADAIELVTLPAAGQTCTPTVALLPASGIVRGRVTTADGQPAVGASVRACRPDGTPLTVGIPAADGSPQSFFRGPRGGAKTDADGRFELTGLPRQRVRLFFEHDHAMTAREIDLTTSSTLDLSIARGRNLEVVNKTPDHALRFRVLDAAGGVLRDDRWSGMHHGARYPIRLPAEAAELEVYDGSHLRLLWRAPITGVDSIEVSAPR